MKSPVFFISNYTESMKRKNDGSAEKSVISIITTVVQI